MGIVTHEWNEQVQIPVIYDIHPPDLRHEILVSARTCHTREKKIHQDAICNEVLGSALRRCAKDCSI